MKTLQDSQKVVDMAAERHRRRWLRGRRSIAIETAIRGDLFWVPWVVFFVLAFVLGVLVGIILSYR